VEIQLDGDLAIGIGLRHIIQCTERQGLEADLGVALGERRYHQHAHAWPRPQEQGQRLEPVHDRHLDVEQDDVGNAAHHVLDGQLAVGVARDDFEPRLFLDPARDETPNHRRIVDDHHSDRRIGKRLLSGSGFRGIHARPLTEHCHVRL